LDLIAILPIERVIKDEKAFEVNVLARLTRIGKLYKIVRLFRLLRLLKNIKAQKVMLP